ncbi:DNA/RNA non-specific endonuclease [Cylindrospermopsis raciborskii]|uniref:DNA/RNA non-specific endonuclease n=1 Tax=Cylindrospermopsis raciborskii TaxID=77022 RepID=UPI003DA56162
MVKLKTLFLVSFAFILVLHGARQIELKAQQKTKQESPHLLLGNPSSAKNSIDSSNNYLMVKKQYALSYNRSHGTANWVAWELNQSWLGNAERQDNFRPDPTLPKQWKRIKPSIYKGSGYDRGHLVPSGDRTPNIEDNSSTFLMTNIIPQTPDNNRNTWGNLEDYSRDLVEQGKTLYIIAGTWGSQGKINNLVNIPKYTWKIIVVLDRPSRISDVTPNTQVIAVNIPNQEELDNDWKKFLTTVDQIEKLTKYDFLSNVPTPIQDVIKRNIAKL